jgi:glycosyltransferase involved in cell wall biosynthesis
MPGKESLARVSVIIPTYNRSDLLRLTVESVLAQTYPNVEIIVVDDASTDNTARMMAQYAGRVVYIRRETNQGSRENLRLGLQAATGEYINFLDHDDLFMPSKLERQVQVLDSQPEIGLVHCGYYHIDKDGNRLEKVVFLPAGTLRELVCTNPIWSGAPLIRRECLDQPGLFDDLIWYSDWGRLLRIALAGYQFACVQEPLGAYRILPNSQMANVAAIERFAIGLLDKIFVESQLPTDVLATKTQTYGNIYLWLSWRYYQAGLWDGAQRAFTEALTLYPQLLEQPEQLLLPSLRYGALNIRVADPVGFTINVFDHLPVCAESLKQYRARILSQVYLDLALRNYGVGSVAEAKRQLAEAINLDPSLLKRPEGFIEALCSNATHLPIEAPLQFVDTVLQNLPAGAQPLERVRSQALSGVSIGSAFENYAAGRQRTTIYQVLTALRYCPSWLKNRGVVSIFVRSLLGLVRQSWPSPLLVLAFWGILVHLITRTFDHLLA